MSNFFMTIIIGVVFISVVNANSGIPDEKDDTEVPEKQCGSNEEFTKCISYCPSYCLLKDGRSPFPCEPIFECKAGCRCKSGFVLNKNNECILEQDCPPFECTEPNKQYSRLGDPCPKTCQNTAGGDNNICIPKRGQSCICKKGFVMDSDSNCIKESECPEICYSPQKTFNKCGPACLKTCHSHPDPNCIEKCVKGCFCDPGYLLSESNLYCYPEDDCPDFNCSLNEELHECAPSCPEEKSCRSLFLGLNQDCSKINETFTCKRKCLCQYGYIRDDYNKCVLPSECCFDPNAEVVKCPNPCKGGTCKQPKFCKCKTKCNPFGCQCKKGFIKSSDTDPSCVAPKNCPK